MDKDRRKTQKPAGRPGNSDAPRAGKPKPPFKKSSSGANGPARAARPAARRPERAAEVEERPVTEEAAALTVTRRQGERPAERVPVILETTGSDGFRLIDSGNGEKLEQYGPYRIVRPDGRIR